MTEWDWWADKLAGKPVQMNPSTPHAGFYRQPYKDFYGARRTFTPIAYWPGENGQLHCRIGDLDVDWKRGQAIWPGVGNHPVSEKAYRDKCQEHDNPTYTGLWPDEHPMVPMDRRDRLGIGGNFPPEEDFESYEGLKKAIEKREQEARARIESNQPIADQNEANQFANLADMLGELQGKAKELEKQEAQPFTEGLKEVRAKWQPIISLADIYLNIKERLITPWLTGRTKEAEEAAAAAAATGEVIEVQRPRVGTRGRRMSLRSTKRAKIVNYAEALAFFSESPDVKSAVQDLANRAVRSGITVPGTEVVEETKAV